MYVLWSRGFEPLAFPMEITINNTNQGRGKREVHSHSSSTTTNQNDGIVMVQLIRADKLEIPEKLAHFSNYCLFFFWFFIF